MIKKLTLALPLVVAIASVSANQDEEISTEFFDFLIEVDDATGNGFTAWLEPKTRIEKTINDENRNITRRQRNERSEK